MASSANGTIPQHGFFQLLTQHPIGFWFIFWGEFAERCSYYGMRAILSLYMADHLGLGKKDAGLYMSLFISACYFLPLAGAYLADNYFGKYNIIVGFSIPYILGHVLLGIEDKWFVVAALVLLAMGSGVIKPNISTLMGLTYDQKRPGQDLLRTQAFSMFYMAINIGAFISQFWLPTIREQYGYFIAFLFPAVLMAVAFIFFACGKPFYAKETISRREKTPEEKELQWKVLSQVALLFLMVMFFWAIFDQSASTWIFYADVFMKNDFFGFTAEQMQSLNALLIVAFLPIVNLIFTILANKGITVRATDKLLLGFILTASTMGVMAYCGHQTGLPEMKYKINPPATFFEKNVFNPLNEAAGDLPYATFKEGWIPVGDDEVALETEYCPEDRKISLWYQAIAYVLLTIAEILISVTGLELAFVAAPKTMKSFVTSLWLLTVALANLLLNAPLSQLYPSMHPGVYFSMLTGMMGGVIVVFLFIAKRFNKAVEEQKAAEKALA